MLGHAIWKYHPEMHRFEIFAEGGGNTFGVAFDDKGRVYSGTNWGKFRGLHYVQGGYYIKGWGKHGPLTNPHALGFFDHMPHVGNADRLVHTFVVYGGDTMPELRGKIVGVNALQRRVQVTRLLKKRLAGDGRGALEALWAIEVVGAFNDDIALTSLAHTSPHVRRWGVRLLGDRRSVSTAVAARLEKLAAEESDAEVRSQL